MPDRRAPSCRRVTLADALESAAETVAGRAVLVDHALKEGMAARLLHKLHVGIKRWSGLPASEEVRRQIQGHVMPSLHPRAEPTGEHGHVDEAHYRASVERSAEVHVVLRGEDPADRAPGSVGPEQEPAGRGREAPAREVAPAEPPIVFGVGSRARGHAYVFQSCRLERVAVFAQAARSAISLRVSAIALAGLSPFGQTFAQFMIVWQR